MPYLVNPQNRIIAIDDEVQYREWLRQPDFREASGIEIARYTARVQGMIDKRRAAEEEEARSRSVVEGIYLNTVSQGGKDGYGIASAKLISAIRKMGKTISLHNEGQNIGLLFHNPYSISSMDNDYLVIYTMFESDKIPDDWLYHLRYADLVLVPSKWCQDVFWKAGIKTTVVPLGYDQDLFQYYQRPNKSANKKPFVFLHYNAFNIRKGFTEVFKAFVDEFDPAEPVRLLLKTTLNKIPIPITQERYPNIIIETGAAEDRELLELIHNSDCLVFPSRGEGFGLTPLECMATGMPVIIPNAHGMSEYFNLQYMYEVKVEGYCPALYAKYKGMNVGQMVVSDVQHLRAQMRYVYEHQQQAMEMGKEASQYVTNWTIDKTAKRLMAVLDEMTQKTPKNNRVKNVLTMQLI